MANGGTQAKTIVVLVMDCVRAPDFPTDGALQVRMPFCESLRKDSLAFSNAVSPSPWTVPAHASLFTGQPPWETNCHWRGDLKLSARFTTLASRLRALGYRTFGLSANPLISPLFNLLGGFDQAAWAGWWEPYLRFGQGGVARHQFPGNSSLDPALSDSIRTGLLDDFIKRSVGPFHKYPFLLEGGTVLSQRIHNDPHRTDWRIARWIEPTFRTWIRGVSRTQPVFAFVNLLEAHEPYFSDPDGGGKFSDWLDYVRTRQDNIGFVAGEWTPRPGELARMHHLYCKMIQALDRRIREIVEILVESNRWDDTLFLLTSDHGQAFGEHGHLFHFLRVDESVIRVPLWVRFPHGEYSGSTSKSWASLIDILPTLVNFAGGAGGSELPGRNLYELAEVARTEPVLAAADGIPFGHIRRRFSLSRLADTDRILIAAYSGSTKLVRDESSGSERIFEVERDPSESYDIIGSRPGEMYELQAVARAAGAKMARSVRAEIDPEVGERLRAWGYT